MTLKLVVAGLALGLSLAGAPALASPTPPPIRVDLTIDYFPQGTPPNPIFQGSALTGVAQFFVPGSSDLGGFTPEGPPIDVGTIGEGQTFTFTFSFIPTDPCLGDGTCTLNFAFFGGAAGFPAMAFDPNAPIPGGAPNTPPIIGLQPPPTGDRGGLQPPPVGDRGPIYAFDAPVQVGTWSVTQSAVPEPSTWALMLAGIGGLGLALQRRRRPLAA